MLGKQATHRKWWYMVIDLRQSLAQRSPKKGRRWARAYGWLCCLVASGIVLRKWINRRVKRPQKWWEFYRELIQVKGRAFQVEWIVAIYPGWSPELELVRWFKGMLWETFACHWVEQCFPDLSGNFSTRPIQRIVAFCWVVRCFPFAHVDEKCYFVPPLNSASTAKNYKTRIDSRRRGIFWGGQLEKKNVLSINWEDDPLRFHTNRRLRLDTRAPDLFDNSGGCVEFHQHVNGENLFQGKGAACAAPAASQLRGTVKFF